MLEMALLGLLTEKEMHGYELKKRLSDVFGLPTAVSFGSLYPALARLKAAGAIEILPPGGTHEGPSPEEALGDIPPGGAAVSGTPQGTYGAGTKVGYEAGPRAACSAGPKASKARPVDAGERAPAGWAGVRARSLRTGRHRKVYRITARGAEMFRELLASGRGATEDDRSFSLRLAFARYLPPEERLGLLEQRRLVLGERLAQLAARARARREDRYMRVLMERQQEELTHDMSWLERLIQEERTVSQSGFGGPSEAGLATRHLQEAPQPALPQPAKAPLAQEPLAQEPLAQAQLARQGTLQAGRPVPLASASQLKRPRDLRVPVAEGSFQAQRPGAGGAGGN